MLVSGTLVVLSIGAFLWLAGALEWRGSAGEGSISVELQCSAPPGRIEATTFLDFDSSSVEVDADSPNEGLRRACPSTKVQSTWKPRQLVNAGKPDAPDDKPIAVAFTADCDKASSLADACQASAPTADRLRFDFPPGKMLHFVGLAERDVSVRVAVFAGKRNGVLTAPRRHTLQIRPPEGFFVASSRPSATLDANDIWNIDVSRYDQPVVIVFSNERLARLDHILDASISAVLGVGVGGILSAWLALRIARTKRAEGADQQ